MAKKTNCYLVFLSVGIYGIEKDVGIYDPTHQESMSASSALRFPRFTRVFPIEKLGISNLWCRLTLRR